MMRERESQQNLCQLHNMMMMMMIVGLSDNINEKQQQALLLLSYLPTPPLRQDMTQGQFLSRV